jgi:hypothetical protein
MSATKNMVTVRFDAARSYQKIDGFGLNISKVRH